MNESLSKNQHAKPTNFEASKTIGQYAERGETVRFLPEHSMIQKVHSGVATHSEGARVRIEGIDLKVW